MTNPGDQPASTFTKRELTAIILCAGYIASNSVIEGLAIHAAIEDADALLKRLAETENRG